MFQGVHQFWASKDMGMDGKGGRQKQLEKRRQYMNDRVKSGYEVMMSTGTHIGQVHILLQGVIKTY